MRTEKSMLAIKTRSLTAITAVAGVAVLGLAACSSSPSSGSASPGSTSTGSVTSSSYPQLARYITRLEKRPTTVNVTQPLDTAIPKGKTIAYIECGSPACVVNGVALKQAVSAVGWKLTTINAGLTVQTIQSAWQQAVVDHPNAVITSGVSRALFNPELAKLKAAGIPVIDMTTADPPGNGLTAVFGWGSQWTSQGNILADYMLVNSGGKPLHELNVNVSAYANISMISDAVAKQLRAQCSSCTTATLNVPVTSIGTDLASRITSYLSSHPSINWVYVGFADMMTGLPAALSAAGLGNVKIVTIDRTTASEEYINQGQSLVMSAGFDVSEMMWRSVDFLLRLWTGKSTAQDTAMNGLPLWVVTKANQPAGEASTGYYPFVVSYPAIYKKLWGVK
jgi:ribose transport system substrate-binding protein